MNDGMLKNIVELIKNNQNFVLTSHVNPDGDSIGSEIALYYYLKNLQKNANIINYSSTPENYLFLDKLRIIEKFDENKHKDVLLNSDVIFILDTNEYKRLKNMEKFVASSHAKKICIDHHLGLNKNGFDLYATDEGSPATGEILYKLFNYIGSNSINSDIATALYTAIMTDTGSFRFPRTSPETHTITAKLIEKGADPVEIYSQVYGRSSVGRVRLLSRFLDVIHLEYNNKLIYSVITLKDFSETGTNEYDSDGFSHFLMNLESSQISVIFTEAKTGIKLSFRSKGDIYVNELAKEFGGGGHKNAAGAWITGYKMPVLINEVITKAKKYIK
jgi:phosphoesterase RecJ-like protein